MTLPLGTCLLIVALVAAGCRLNAHRRKPASPPRPQLSHVRVITPSIAEQVDSIPVLYDRAELGWDQGSTR